MMIRRNLTGERGVEGYTNIQNEIIRFQSRIQYDNEAVQEHRTLNAYIDAYVKKMSRKDKEEQLNSSATNKLVIDFD